MRVAVAPRVHSVTPPDAAPRLRTRVLDDPCDLAFSRTVVRAGRSWFTGSMPQGGTLAPPRNARVVDVEVAGRPVLRVARGDDRVTLGLVMPGIDRTVDVSVSPVTALRALHDAAQRGATPPGRAEADLRAALYDLGDRATAGPVSADVPLVALLGAAAFPILAAAYDAGAAPLEEVPRWASDILAASTVRVAATRAFGATATRPVVAALARSLLRGPGEPVDLSRLGLALIGTGVLEPDQLAGVLTAPGEAPGATVAPGLSPSQIREARRAAARWGAERTSTYLRSAAIDADHRQLFTECLRWAIDLGAHAPLRLPRDLADLSVLYRSQVRSVAEPPSPPQRRETRVHAPVDPAPEPRTDPPVVRRPGGTAPNYGLHLAPRVAHAPTVTNGTRIPHPRWLRRVDDTTTATFRFVLPRTCGDLVRWARLLGNCLDSYQAAAVTGASHLVGIEAGGLIRYVIELTPDRHIRQFAGQANRGPSGPNHDEIIEHLHALRVID